MANRKDHDVLGSLFGAIAAAVTSQAQTPEGRYFHQWIRNRYPYELVR